jgi:hypothetical protein
MMFEEGKKNKNGALEKKKEKIKFQKEMMQLKTGLKSIKII